MIDPWRSLRPTNLEGEDDVYLLFRDILHNP